jgi:hypothetical protein
MKKIILVLIFCVLSSPVFAADIIAYDKVEGTVFHTFWTATTGAWQAVSIPSTVENTRHVLIQVHDGVEGYAHSDVQFLFSSASDGTGWQYCEGTLAIPIGKKASAVLIYIKAAGSQQIAVSCLR